MTSLAELPVIVTSCDTSSAYQPSQRDHHTGDRDYGPEGEGCLNRMRALAKAVRCTLETLRMIDLITVILKGSGRRLVRHAVELGALD